MDRSTMRAVTRFAIILFLLASSASAAVLPGFRAELVGASNAFVTSIDTDASGILYYTTAAGEVRRMSATGTSETVAVLPTAWEGNAGLLGVAMLDDGNAVVHYTRIGRGWHVISRVDTKTGRETVLREMASDPDFPGREVSTEHHGGNLTIGPDGSIYFGIGDFGGGLPAALPNWIAGKIWRLHPDGRLQQYAMGLRNPYDLAYDPQLGRVVVADNGPTAGDEIHIVSEGNNLGWPFTVGNQEPIENAVKPDYVFPNTIAPTGLLRLSGANAIARRGYLLSAFVTRAIYYFPEITQQPLRAPIEIVRGFEGGPVIDVTEAPGGEIYFATGMGIYRLHTPARGDCNGDGLADRRDLAALQLELLDGSSQPMLDAPLGAHAGSWGCDANADSVIDASDATALAQMVGSGKRRSARH